MSVPLGAAAFGLTVAIFGGILVRHGARPLRTFCWMLVLLAAVVVARMFIDAN